MDGTQIYGYARVSTGKQNIERQVRNIQEQYPKAFIVQEAYTGTTTSRPQWDRLYRRIQKDIQAHKTVMLVFDAVSRMSRNADEGFSLYKNLYQQGVELVFIKEPHINSSVYKTAMQNSIEATGNEIADIYIDATNKVLMLLAERQIRIAFEQAEKEVQDLHKRTSEGMLTAKLNGKRIGRQTGDRVVTAKQLRAEKIIVEKNKDFGGQLNDSETRLLIGCSYNSYYKYKKICKNK